MTNLHAVTRCLFKSHMWLFCSLFTDVTTEQCNSLSLQHPAKCYSVECTGSQQFSDQAFRGYSSTWDSVHMEKCFQWNWSGYNEHITLHGGQFNYECSTFPLLYCPRCIRAPVKLRKSLSFINVLILLRCWPMFRHHELMTHKMQK